MNDDFIKTLNEADGYARFVVRSAKDEIQFIIGKIGGKFEDSSIMKLYDAYCCGFLFFINLTLLKEFETEKVSEQIEITLVDISKILVYISAELATGSNFPTDYMSLRKTWFNDDPLSNPILYTDKIVRDYFKSNQAESIFESYDRFRKKIDEAIRS